MARRAQKPVATGVEVRHSRACAVMLPKPKPCDCKPRFRGVAFTPSRRRSKPFATPEEAVKWRADRLVEWRLSGVETIQSSTTIGVLLDEIVKGMLPDEIVDGISTVRIRKQGGDEYKPSSAHSYKVNSNKYLKPHFGRMRISSLSRNDVQTFIDELALSGKQGQTIRNILMPLRLVVRRAIQAGTIKASPLGYLNTPASKGRRDRAATPSEIRALMKTFDVSCSAGLIDRAAWALFLFAGLRLAEAQGLTWGSINFEHSELHVERVWHDSTKRLLPRPKSAAGNRFISFPEILEEALIELRLSQGIPGPDEFVLLDVRTGYPTTQPLIRKRGKKAWLTAGLESYTPHEGRHTFGSLSSASGTNSWDLAVLMGHSDPKITAERYRHIYREERKRASSKLDEYLRED